MTVSLGDLTLANPVLTAAGCAGPELSQLCDLAALGAYVTRTVTLDSRTGPTGRRHAETASGLVTDLGLENPGVHALLATELPALAQQQVRTIVAIHGRSLGEYAELARRAGGAPGVSGLEVTFPDDDPYAAGKLLAVVRRDAPRGVAVLAKLPSTGAPLDLARELVKNGADALVVGHPAIGLAIDPDTLTLAVRGPVSGPAVLPQSLQAVWRVHEAMPATPLVGVGGIRSGADALAMLAAGATAVQVGSALLHDPSAAHRVIAELKALLDVKGLKPADAVGIAHRPFPRTDHR